VVYTILEDSTSSECGGLSHQRNSFFAKDRFWVFYCDNTAKSVYYCSFNGDGWKDAADTGLQTQAQHFSVCVDENGEYVHAVAGGYGVGGLYRRGLLNSDGTITWDAIQNFDARFCVLPTIMLDSDGYPWVGYVYRVDTLYYPAVGRSSTNDGTWTDLSGYPYLLSAAVSNLYWGIIPLELAPGKFLVIYGVSGATIKAVTITDGVFGSEETATSYNVYAGAMSAIADLDGNVYLAYNHVTAYRTVSRVKRDFASDTWGTETTIKNYALTNDYIMGSFCLDEETGDIYYFYLDNDDDKMYLLKCVSGVWQTAQVWLENEHYQGNVGWVRGDVLVYAKKMFYFIGVTWVIEHDDQTLFDLRCEFYSLVPTHMTYANAF
jgi:hypothetical protein